MMKKRNKKHSVIQRLLLLAVSVYLLYSLGDLQYQLIAQKKEYAALEEKKLIISQQIAEYESLLDEGTEAELIAWAAGSRLGYSFPNDKFYVDVN